MRTLRVGIDDAPPVPLQIGSPRNGDFRGYEVDLLDTLAERMNFRISYRRALWTTLIDELKMSRLDLVCSAATVTAERARDVDFCAPHLKISLALVTAEAAKDSFDLRLSRIGVRKGTTAETYLFKEAARKGPNMVSDSNDELYARLSKNELDGVIDDSPIARYFSTSVSGLRYAGALFGTESEYAIAVQKANVTLQSEIDRAIEHLESEGTLPQLREFWFGNPDLRVS